MKESCLGGLGAVTSLMVLEASAGGEVRREGRDEGTGMRKPPLSCLKLPICARPGKNKSIIKPVQCFLGLL